MKHLRAWTALSLAAALSVVGLASAQADGAGDLKPRPLLAAPVNPLSAVRLFDPPPERWNAGHRGIDLLTSPGAQVHAPGSGTVVFAGSVVNRPVVSIDLDIGLLATLEPVTATLTVGARTDLGDVVGTIADSAAASHCAPRHCIHWGLRRGEEYLDPLDWLAGFGPIRLLPLRPADSRLS